MNKNVLYLINELNKLTTPSHYPSHLKIRVLELNYLADEYKNRVDTVDLNINLTHEIKKRMFKLLGIIPDCRVDNEFIHTFSDLIIEFIEEAKKGDEDMSDLISALNDMSISFNLEKSLKKLRM
jgi:hypothetical protein